MCKVNNKNGFTLIELMVVIVILGIISAIMIPRLVGVIERARITADQATVRTLNTATNMFRLITSSSDPFEDKTKNNQDLLDVLIEGGYLSAFVEPQTKGAMFEWLFEKEKWYLFFEGVLYHSETPSEHFEVGNPSNFRITSYDGKAGTDLVIPGKINGVSITQIGHGAFVDKGLTDVVLPNSIESISALAFRNNSIEKIILSDQLVTIGNIAFDNNKLTEIIIPESVISVGDGAFHNNPIERIVIGAGVIIGDSYSFGIHRPGGDNNFDKIYKSEEGGAGTYIWDGQSWLKQ